jgi:2-keto-4-pentenoate hydratase/2-oxohepta-3-ene-1,7-dioic acid hydratase in catechol pathway
LGTSVVRYEGTGDGAPGWGVLRGANIFPIDLEMASHREVMQRYFNDRASFDAAMSQASIPLAEVTLSAPVSADVQLFCQGLNYADHREEGGLDDGANGENLIFGKASSSICGPNDDIVRPRGCELLDYEIELGIVLKSDVQASQNVAESDLEHLIGGLVMANDVSSRDDQFGATAMQWFKGKSYRTFCPMGPILYLLDAGDLAQLYQLQLTLTLNGVVKQNASTDLLIHKPAATLTEISSFADLRRGDCILTGTPGGVLLEMDLKTGLSIMLNMKNDAKRRAKFVAAQRAKTRFLQPGDVLELQIKSLDGSIDLGKPNRRGLVVLTLYKNAGDPDGTFVRRESCAPNLDDGYRHSFGYWSRRCRLQQDPRD